jgi:hypothetical protein
MNLIFEIGKEGRGLSLLPKCDVPETSLPENMKRQTKLHLPELSENEISRHYTKLAQRTHGVNNGFYPLGSCTMKYNPKVNEYAASLKGFTRLHPLQEEKYAQGALEVMQMTENSLSEILGMDAFALGLLKAARLMEDGRIDQFIADRYSSYNTGVGARIRSGEATLAELAAYAEEMGAPALPGSGRQEYLESVVNQILYT